MPRHHNHTHTLHVRFGDLIVIVACGHSKGTSSRTSERVRDQVNEFDPSLQFSYLFDRNTHEQYTTSCLERIELSVGMCVCIFFFVLAFDVFCV